jgi:membrane-associated phospholipid phosphatase
MRSALLLALALLAPITGVDEALQRAVQQGRAPWLEPPMRAASGIGRPAVVLGALLAIAVFDPVAGVPTARLALAVLVPTNLVVEGLKRAVNRPRPDGEHKRSNASFPSSHAANAAALAWVVSRRWRKLAPLWWAGAALIAWSRLYLNRHYASDVVAGIALGALVAWAVVRIMERAAARGPAASG